MLLFGWIGFNGGSALSANLRAAQAAYVSLISASSGGLVWLLLDYRLERKLSVIALCSGIITGLVSVTPCSGYVGAPAGKSKHCFSGSCHLMLRFLDLALAIGCLGAAAANLATRLKYLLHIDETL